MEKSKALSIVKTQLTEQRYQHTLGVLESALDLSTRFEGNKSAVELAAIFHDYSKFRPKEEMRKIIQEQAYSVDLLDFHHELWHAPVGAYLVQEEVGIHDKEILAAIRWHTTGRADMSLTERIVFLADYIEPGRKFPGVEEVRELAKHNLNHAVIKASENTIRFLLDKNQPIYPDTLNTYNFYIRLEKQ